MNIFGLFQPQQDESELDALFEGYEQDIFPEDMEDEDDDDFTLEDFESNNEALNSFGFTPYEVEDDDFNFDDFLSDNWGQDDD